MLPRLTPEYIFQSAKVFTLGVAGAPGNDNAKTAQQAFQEYSKFKVFNQSNFMRHIIFANMCQR